MINKYYFFVFSFVFLFSCAKQEARYPVQVKTGTDYRQSIELAKKINQKEERIFIKYATDNKLVFERSSFGFQYIIKRVAGDSIKTGDLVKYTRIIESVDGSVIYPKQNCSLLIDRQVEINGLHEGLKLMTKGSSATFLFPSHQAYGYHGDENKILSNTPLVVKVEVNDVDFNY